MIGEWTMKTVSPANAVVTLRVTTGDQPSRGRNFAQFVNLVFLPSRRDLLFVCPGFEPAHVYSVGWSLFPENCLTPHVRASVEVAGLEESVVESLLAGGWKELKDGDEGGIEPGGGR